MNIDSALIRVTKWERGPATSAITLTYQGISELPILNATFEAPPGCSDDESLTLAHHWFHMLCTSLGTCTKEWILAEAREEALRKKQK